MKGIQIFLILLSLMLTTNTFAQGPNFGYKSYNDYNNNYNKNVNKNANINGNLNANKNTNLAKGGNAYQDQGQEQNQKQLQGQLQGQAQGQKQNANNEGNSQNTNINFEDKREAASAAFSFAGSCHSGIAGQGVSHGFSAAKTNDICNHLMIADALYKFGDKDGALEHVKKAAGIANWKGAFGYFTTFITLGIL